MAWVLKFDGGNDYALADFAESMSQSFTIKIRFRSSDLTTDARLFALTRGASRPLVAIGTGTSAATRDNIRFFFATDGNVEEISYITTDAEAAPFGDNLFHELEVFFDNGALSIVLDGGSSVSIGSYTPADYTVEQISLGAIYRTSPSAFLECDIEYVQVSGDIDYDWDATASSHAAGTPRLLNTLDGSGLTDAFTFFMPTDGSAWEDLGGGGVSITPNTINSASVSNNPAITFNSVVSLTPNAIDSLSVANNPLIQFNSIVNISPATIDSASISNDPILSFSAVLNITPQAINSASAANNPSILFNSVLSLAPSTIDSLSVSNDPVIEFKSVINILPQAIDSLSVSRNPFISFGVVQTIGNVTASFKDSGISVKYEEDEINVGYKPNAITVNFK